MDDESRLHWLWLSCLGSISWKKQDLLLERFGGPGSLWKADTSELKHIVELNEDDIVSIRNPAIKADASRKMEWLIRNRITIVAKSDADYPAELDNVYQPPPVLFIKGIMPCGSSRKDFESGAVKHKTIGIVGSRKPTTYGSQVGYSLALQLARNDIAVISGMAKGIDTCAHAGALKAGGKTVAVLGCGIDKPYPAENKALMERISASGAVITEYPPGTPPVSYHFPARNRIISGLSQNLLVVEAGKRSGALITADFGIEYGKDVFAVPGNITSVQSIGTNRLIKDGAKIVTCVEDILEEYGIGGTYQPMDSPELLKLMYSHGGELSGDELKILVYLSSSPRHIDIIAKDFGMTVSRAGSMLLLMELKGIIEQLPGYFYRVSLMPSEPSGVNNRKKDSDWSI